MNITLHNSQETAIAPHVLVKWLHLKLARPPSDCTEVQQEGAKITYKCTLGRLLLEGKSAHASLEFDMSDLYVRDGTLNTELIFNVSAWTVSDAIYRPAQASQMVPLSASADVHVDGSRYLESFTMDTLARYVKFEHTFEIEMDGPSSIADILVKFRLPVNLTSQNKFKDMQVVNVRGVKRDLDHRVSCQATEGQFSESDAGLISDPSADYDELDPDLDAAGIGGFIGKDKDLSKKSNSTLVEKDRLLIHCNSPHVECMEVTCKLPVYKPGAVTVITLIMDMEADIISNVIWRQKKIILSKKNCLIRFILFFF